MPGKMRHIHIVFLVALLIVLGAGAEPAVGGDADMAGRYQGTLSCAGCVDSGYRLDLFPDGVYYLRVTQTGPQNASHDDVGRWIKSTDDRILVLKGREKLARYFVPDAEGQLRAYEAGQGVLERNDKLPALEPGGAFLGLFRYLADAPSFDDCASGRTVPVEMAGAYPDLQRSYLRLQRAPGEALMAQINGSLKLLPSIEGGRLVPTLHVDKTLGFRPGVTCPAVLRNAPLRGTRWVLVRLGAQQIEVPAATLTGRRALPHTPHLILEKNRAALSGAGGCNRINGRYALTAEGATFQTLQTSGMACASGMDIERGLLSALASARKWRVAGDLLELLDDDSVLLARFFAAQ